MSSTKLWLAKTPVLGGCLLFAYRAMVGFRYFQTPVWNLVRWLFTSRETTNFTYDLDEANKRYLAALLAEITKADFNAVLGYIKELEGDLALRAHIAAATQKSDQAFMADSDVRYGRRVGWYALVRLTKPRTVIETGLDKGLGACVLAAAIARNTTEGYPGRYFGTDINPHAGYLLSGEYANYGEILLGDSIESLKAFEHPIDLFINDSDHSARYEAEEYSIIAKKLSERAVILGDNSHSTSELLDFSLKTGRRFVFFQERPVRHWYPGGGIGISLAAEPTTNALQHQPAFQSS